MGAVRKGITLDFLRALSVLARNKGLFAMVFIFGVLLSVVIVGFQAKHASMQAAPAKVEQTFYTLFSPAGYFIENKGKPEQSFRVLHSVKELEYILNSLIGPEIVAKGRYKHFTLTVKKPAVRNVLELYYHGPEKSEKLVTSIFKQVMEKLAAYNSRGKQTRQKRLQLLNARKQTAQGSVLASIELKISHIKASEQSFVPAALLGPVQVKNTNTPAVTSHETVALVRLFLVLLFFTLLLAAMSCFLKELLVDLSKSFHLIHNKE